MANATAMCTSFKQQILNKEHDLDTDSLKIALYSSAASLGAAYTAYSTTNEITGTGYTAAGSALAGAALATSGTTAYADFTDVSWTGASFTANAALIYNTSAANKAISTHYFGGDQTVTAATFTLQFPAPDASNAIIRIA